MPQYMLLLHEDPTHTFAMSPEEMQRVVQEYSAWCDGLVAGGRLAGGVKLTEEGGRHVRRGADGAAAVTDGPYVEGKEVVGGYFMLNAADYDEAAAIAADCPHLVRGWVEVRAVDPL